MNVKKTLFLGFLVCLLFLTKTNVLAQPAGTYSFTKTGGNFTPLGPLTPIVNGDDIMSTSQTIGFTFNYAGQNYTSYKVSTNGFINLGGNLTGALATNQLNSTSNTPIIAPLWDDLSSEVVAEVSGSPGNQVLTVEWRNVKWRYNAANAGFTFQAKLYEADGKIEFIYGDSTAASSTPTASIGLNSAPGGSGNFLSVNALGSSASSATETSNIAIWPGLNTVYVFEKPAAGPPVADFVASNVTPGVGENVNLTDLSVANPPATAWSWTITPANYTFVTGNQNSQNPVVQFTQMGLYTVKLVVTNPMGTDSITKVNYINVGYCTAGATSSGDTDIGQFTFDTFVNGSATPVTNNPAANGTYSNFTNLGPIQVNINGSYPMTVSHITSGANFYNAYIKVFIDYNQNGAFEAGEVVLEGGTTQAAPTISGTVNIPPTASLGLTRLRVVQRENGNTTTTTPCGTFTWGEVEDYTVEILPAIPCTNPPVAGTASATPTTVFPNDPVYFDLTGYSGSVQWQYSTDGVNFTNISGATSVPDTLYANGIGTFYVRAMVYTPNCPPDSSNIVTINVVPRTGDMPNNPKVITTNFYTDTDSTFGYTNNYSGPFNQPSNDIFYQYIIPNCIDSIEINTCLSAFDSYMHVLINGNHVASDDDGCGGGVGVGSKIILDTTDYNAGDTLLIVVEGYSNIQGTYTLSFMAYSGAPAAPSVVNDTICAGNTAMLMASGSGTLLWYDVPSGGTSVATGNTFTTPVLMADSTYYVESVVGSCTSSRVPVTAHVIPTPSDPVVQNDTACVGTPAILVANGMGTIHWYDTPGGNLVSTSDTLIIPALTNDTVFYALVEVNGCVSNAVPVHAVVQNPGSITVFVPDTVQVGQPFPVSASGGLTYSWSFGVGATPDTASGPGPHIVTMMMPGLHFITLYATVECGVGTDSIIIPIFVSPITAVQAQGIFQSVSVYPNPNKGSFNLKALLTQNTNLTFEVYNNMGQLVHQNRYQETSFVNEAYQLNISSGVYSYKLVSSNGIFVGKFIVE